MQFIREKIECILGRGFFEIVSFTREGGLPLIRRLLRDIFFFKFCHIKKFNVCSFYIFVKNIAHEMDQVVL